MIELTLIFKDKRGTEMKRIIAILLCTLMLASILASCSEKNTGSGTTQQSENDATPNTPDGPAVEYPIDVTTTCEILEHDKDTVSLNSLSSATFNSSTDKDPYDYKVGEDVKFTISLRSGRNYVVCNTFRVTVRHDGIEGEQVYEVSGETGAITVVTQVAQPGFVIVDVDVLDDNGDVVTKAGTVHSGAGAEVNKIAHAGAEPEDFDEFWDNAIAELLKIDPEIIKFEKIETKNGHDYYDVRILAVDDAQYFKDRNEAIEADHNYVTGILAVPTNAKANSCGIKITFDGHGVHKSAVSGLDGNTIIFDVLAHSIEANRETSFYTGQNNLINRYGIYGLEYENETDPNNVYFKNMILRNLQACRFLVSYFGENGEGENLWNGKDFVLDGFSQGGFQAVAVAALAEKVDVTISYAVIGAPWLSDLPAHAAGGDAINSVFWPKGDFTNVLGYYDTAFLAKRVTCKARVKIGLGDETTPPAGVTLVYFNLASEDKELIYVQNKSHGDEIMPKEFKYEEK